VALYTPLLTLTNALGLGIGMPYDWQGNCTSDIEQAMCVTDILGSSTGLQAQWLR